LTALARRKQHACNRLHKTRASRLVNAREGKMAERIKYLMYHGVHYARVTSLP
jgi:hypothetical protein